MTATEYDLDNSAWTDAVAAAIVIATRLVIPLSILRWPLAGGIACLLVDAFDVVLVDALANVLGQPLEFGPFYAQLDKWLDTYYLAFEAFVARSWPETVLRRATLLLFAWRVIGVLLFELTAYRPLLLAFPNLFENVFLYTLIARRFAPQLVPKTIRQTLVVPGRPTRAEARPGVGPPLGGDASVAVAAPNHLRAPLT